MKPANLQTKIFLDSGNPEETKDILQKLGFLDGQTTNPSLIAKNPEAQARLQEGNKFSAEEVNNFYKEVITDIRSQLTEGQSISIEVYADADTDAETMIEQGRVMNTWIPDAHIKLPTTAAGLEAAAALTSEGMRVNMTLVFTEDQAGAVYAATTGEKGDVFLSPFIGRLDDKGERGMSLIENVTKLYKESGDGHVEVLVASIRSLDHLVSTLELGADIATVPGRILVEWADAGMPTSFADMNKEAPDQSDLTDIEFKNVNLESDVSGFDITHELTDTGLAKFAADWNNMVG